MTTKEDPIHQFFREITDYAGRSSFLLQDEGSGAASSSSGAAGPASASEARPPALNLSQESLSRVHARARALSRQMHPDLSPDVVDAHVASLMASLGIDASQIRSLLLRNPSSSAALSSRGWSGVGMNAEMNPNSGFDQDLDPSNPSAGGGSRSAAEEAEGDVPWEEVYAQYLQEYDAQLTAPTESRRISYQRVPLSAATSAQQRQMFSSAEAAFERGLLLFKEGQLEESVLVLETALDLNQPSGALAQSVPSSLPIWHFLGLAHAESDNDTQAIAALLEAVDSDGKNLDALLELGVSYTNELDRMQALMYLRQWVERHPIYHVLSTEGLRAEESAPLSYSAMGPGLADLFERAREMNPSDPDVLVVLGVLHNVTGKFDLAVQSFKEALRFHPGDYSLWNRIGATLANSNRPAEAIHAYRQALALKPTYVRAWVNMGIALSNQAIFDEAIRSYARALELLGSHSGARDHIWDYVRIAVACSGGSAALLAACASKDLEAILGAFSGPSSGGGE